MSLKEELYTQFNKYNPLIFDLNVLNNPDINKFETADILYSNNIAYPEFKLGFNHYIHQAKDKMVVLENYTSRKKIYLVTSLFEKNIDYKEKTDNGLEFTSIDTGVKKLIKQINPNFPNMLNRAFLKLWEMLIMFDLISDNDDFISSHLAEGPGSFIQATIFYRELQKYLKIIKTCKNDKYFGVTLYSDHEHLQMQKDFINFFAKENPKRLHILETQPIKDNKDLFGGAKNDEYTNGDITKLKTINIFGGSKLKQGYAEPSDLITADGGFDWKKENLQEQEAYTLIFSEIVLALKIQKNGGNFVIKIFESYTTITIKMIEMLRLFYKQVYLCKPYTSRISNSEKYIICKNFEKKNISSNTYKNLEEMITTMNKNSNFNIIDIFSDFIINEKTYNFYKDINIELMLKQYVGINNIIKFINLDNKHGIEYNNFIDLQINAAYFWNSTFLDYNNYNKIFKIFSQFNFLTFKKQVFSELDYIAKKEENLVIESKEDIVHPKRIVYSKKNIELIEVNNSKTKKNYNKSKKINQKGGNLVSEESSTNDNKIILTSSERDQNISEESINSSEEIIGHLDSESEFIELNKIKIK